MAFDYDPISKDRLKPINNGTVRNGDIVYTEYLCPCCGNPVRKRDNKFTCGACQQKLLWPDVDYSEYDKKGQEIEQRKQAYLESRRNYFKTQKEKRFNNQDDQDKVINS